MSEFTEHRVPAGKLDLHVTETGSGPVLVWLHGAGPGASGMGNFRQNLPAFRDYRNLVFDLPRFGRSDKPVLGADEYFAPYAATAIAAALGELGASQFSVIGNSMGGATAIKLAADNPHSIDRLVLMAAVGTAPSRWEGDLPPGILKIAEWLREGTSERLIHEFAELQVYDAGVLTKELLQERLDAANDPEILATNGVTNMLPGDLNPDMPKITAPTLLLWGREDKFIPLEWALNALRTIPNASLRIIPFCGHWVQFEHREYFNTVVLEHLSQPSLAA